MFTLDEEENFAWYDINDKDNFFVLTTLSKHAFPKGSQVFHCYGRRSNGDLLSHYGFSLACNKYESLRFNVTVDFGWRKAMEKEA